MMLEPGCTAGSTISSRPVRGPVAMSRRSLAILLRSSDVRAERAAERRDVAHALHELDAVLPLRAARALITSRRYLHHQPGILRLDVDAGADRAAADAQVAQLVGRLASFCRCRRDRMPVRGELLAEPDRHRVLQVRAARFDDVVELLSLAPGAPRRADRTRPGCAGRAASVARRIAVGITSLVLCAMLT